MKVRTARDKSITETLNGNFFVNIYIYKGTNYTATCLPSRKLSKLDEPDMQDTAGEAGTSS